MENLNISRFEAKIINLPTSYFFIGISIIIASLALFFTISISIGYADEYSIDTLVTNQNSNIVLIKDISPEIIKKIKLYQQVKISLSISNKFVEQNGVIININPKYNEITIKAGQGFKTARTGSKNNIIYSKLRFSGEKKNILERILGDKKIFTN